MTTTVKFPPLDPGDLGTDVAVMDDVNQVWNLVSGKTNLAYSQYRRLNTPNGGLFYDQRYGEDVKDLCNADLTAAQISAAKARIKAQLMLDERVESVDVTMTFAPTPGTLDITIFNETADGPFTLVLRATSVTLSILTIDGVPVTPDITPDFIAADVAETPEGVVFPPAPPAIGSLAGNAAISLALSATATQPVADSYLYFSGYASASGLAETHANGGASSSLLPSQGVAYTPPACTLRALIVKPLANTRMVATLFSVYKNGAPTGLQVSVPAGGTAATSISGASVDFNGVSDTFSLVSSGSPTGAIAFGARVETGFVKFLKFAGIHSPDVGTADTCYLADSPGYSSNRAPSYVPPACTIKGLRLAVSSTKSRSKAMTVTLYKNGVAQPMTVTIPAGGVGVFSDTATGHSVSFNGTTDKLDLVSTRAGGGVATMDYQVFNTPGTFTWTKPIDAITTEDIEYGAGGGGSSGASFGVAGGSGGDSRTGGGGGGGGGVSKNTHPADFFPATVPVTVGSKGLGAPAGSASAGTDGGSASFGVYGTATGGRGGQPQGFTTGGPGGAGGSGNAGTGGTGGQGGDSGSGGNGRDGQAATGLAAPGGGGGQLGGLPGTGHHGGRGGGAGGVGGGDNANGGDGGDNSSNGNHELRAGTAGGGGGQATDAALDGGTTAPAGAGGRGGRYGAGGGGGGGARGSSSGGAGGDGGDAAVEVVTTVRAGNVAMTATLEIA